MATVMGLWSNHWRFCSDCVWSPLQIIAPASHSLRCKSKQSQMLPSTAKFQVRVCACVSFITSNLFAIFWSRMWARKRWCVVLSTGLCEVNSVYCRYKYSRSCNSCNKSVQQARILITLANASSSMEIYYMQIISGDTLWHLFQCFLVYAYNFDRCISDTLIWHSSYHLFVYSSTLGGIVKPPFVIRSTSGKTKAEKRWFIPTKIKYTQ